MHVVILQSEYHIVYFGKPVSRVWVEADGVEPFTENCPQTEVLDAVSLCYIYSSFRGFSPCCTLHTAITHVISVFERQSLTHDYAVGIHVRHHRSNTLSHE